MRNVKSFGSFPPKKKKQDFISVRHLPLNRCDQLKAQNVPSPDDTACAAADSPLG